MSSSARKKVEILADGSFYKDLQALRASDPEQCAELWAKVKASLRYVDSWEANVIFAPPPRARHFTVRETGGYAVHGFKLRHDRILLLAVRK